MKGPLLNKMHCSKIPPPSINSIINIWHHYHLLLNYKLVQVVVEFMAAALLDCIRFWCVPNKVAS